MEMKTVDELMALADAAVDAAKVSAIHPVAMTSSIYEKRRAALLTALQEALREPYDQQALELCEACGWKTLIPGNSCLNCVRSIDTSQEPVEKSGGSVQVQLARDNRDTDEALLRQALGIISANYAEEYDEAHELSVERAIRARLEGGV